MSVREVLPSFPSRQLALQPTRQSHYYNLAPWPAAWHPWARTPMYTPPTSRPTTEPNQPTLQLYPTCTTLPPQWAGRLATTGCTHIPHYQGVYPG